MKTKMMIFSFLLMLCVSVWVTPQRASAQGVPAQINSPNIKNQKHQPDTTQPPKQQAQPEHPGQPPKQRQTHPRHQNQPTKQQQLQPQGPGQPPKQQHSQPQQTNPGKNAEKDQQSTQDKTPKSMGI